MQIGEKIRRIREHRCLTQKELGYLVGFSYQQQVRIAQYEKGFRIPKPELINRFADALEVDVLALIGEDSEQNEIAIMEHLFWLEESNSVYINVEPSRFQSSEQDLHQASRIYMVQSETDRVNYEIPTPNSTPTMLWFGDSKIDSNMKDWSNAKKLLKIGRVSQKQYFEWKLQWPNGPKSPSRPSPVLCVRVPEIFLNDDKWNVLAHADPLQEKAKIKAALGSGKIWPEDLLGPEKIMVDDIQPNKADEPTEG